ncbi:MAG: hypothetical protein JWM57_4119 [Phycisphaerales bacterium]|nr:hypothetical protein [Phycisphaerales bacterium]
MRTHGLVWLFATIFVVVTIMAVGDAGLRLRRAVWDSSRQIRFHGDIAHAFRWAQEVNVRAGQAAGDGHEPTLWQLIRAEGQYYRDLVENTPDGNYLLDYPPFRLLTMALWQRHVHREYPDLHDWPGPWEPGKRRGDLTTDATEEIAWPLLALNTCAEAATAVLAAVLVGLWIWRSGPAVRLRPRADGVIPFMISSAAFFYAWRIAVFPVPAPPPSITIAAPPRLVRSSDTQLTATVSAAINPQGAATTWWVEWGLVEGHYTHALPKQRIDGASVISVSADLFVLPERATLHYCVVARNEAVGDAGAFGRGTTRTPDAVLVSDLIVQPRQPSATVGAVWFSAEEWGWIAVVFVVMCWSLNRMDFRHRAWASALVCGVAIWFSPPLLVDAHAWPQWEAWLLPPLLLAMLLASLDCWFMAGAVMAFGMMFKGQFLIGMPILVLWPLLGMQWRATIRLAVGFALTAGLLLSPWTVLNSHAPSVFPQPLWWIGGVCLAAALVTGHSLICRRRTIRRRVESASPKSIVPMALRIFVVAMVIEAAALLVLAPWPTNAGAGRGWNILLLLCVLVGPWLLPRRSLGVWFAGVLAATVWLAVWAYHGDWSWKTVGFEYGTHKFERAALSVGSNSNLASILVDRFGWELHDPAFSLSPPNIAALWYGGQSPDSVPSWVHDWNLDGAMMTLDLKQTTIVIYAVLLLVCGTAAAVHSRRRDTRILAAFIAPWVLMPNVLCQMMCRYQLWGAVLSAMLIAVRPELLLLHVLFSLLAAGMIGNQLLGGEAGRSPLIHDLMSRLAPDGGWIMLMAAASVLFLAVTPSAGRRNAAGRRGRSLPAATQSRSVAHGVPAASMSNPPA